MSVIINGNILVKISFKSSFSLLIKFNFLIFVKLLIESGNFSSSLLLKSNVIKFIKSPKLSGKFVVLVLLKFNVVRFINLLIYSGNISNPVSLKFNVFRFINFSNDGIFSQSINSNFSIFSFSILPIIFIFSISNSLSPLNLLSWSPKLNSNLPLVSHIFSKYDVVINPSSPNRSSCLLIYLDFNSNLFKFSVYGISLNSVILDVPSITLSGFMSRTIISKFLIIS